MQDAEYVRIPYPLWLDLVEAIHTHLIEDDEVAEALIAIGEALAGPLDKEQMDRSLEAVRQRLFGRDELQGTPACPEQIDGNVCG